jgi:hypothetical protein
VQIKTRMQVHQNACVSWLLEQFRGLSGWAAGSGEEGGAYTRCRAVIEDQLDGTVPSNCVSESNLHHTVN